MFWAVTAYLVAWGVIGHIDVLFVQGGLGVYVSKLLPWNK